jgi:hypothetical protein
MIRLFYLCISKGAGVFVLGLKVQLLICGIYC